MHGKLRPSQPEPHWVPLQDCRAPATAPGRREWPKERKGLRQTHEGTLWPPGARTSAEPSPALVPSSGGRESGAVMGRKPWPSSERDPQFPRDPPTPAVNSVRPSPARRLTKALCPAEPPRLRFLKSSWRKIKDRDKIAERSRVDQAGREAATEGGGNSRPRGCFSSKTPRTGVALEGTRRNRQTPKLQFERKGFFSPNKDGRTQGLPKFANSSPDLSGDWNWPLVTRFRHTVRP
ncbi:PREDICTED: uncharacterized protein LOC102028504 [Chinchilla lanigera]|uniref:uncharacterized protein LOC102028504 n=1 Tax=Chinchilla lanigera TaxID=34839 RepID=UPI00038ECC5A|nr:PREDICTED: uncharacterized protein LOC102028504 [Chinchilla lanigera]